MRDRQELPPDPLHQRRVPVVELAAYCLIILADRIPGDEAGPIGERQPHRGNERRERQSKTGDPETILLHRGTGYTFKSSVQIVIALASLAALR